MDDFTFWHRLLLSLNFGLSTYLSQKVKSPNVFHRSAGLYAHLKKIWNNVASCLYFILCVRVYDTFQEIIVPVLSK